MENNNTVQKFLNETFGEVRAFTKDSKEWFCANDCLSILEYSESGWRTKVSRLNKKGVTKVKINTSGGNQELNFIDETNLIELISSSRIKDSQVKQDIYNWLIKKKYTDNIKLSCNEIEFINKLERILKQFDIKGIRQYKTLSYRIDYYIPELNIAVEYDENEHKYYTYDKQEGRQREIEEELGCRFIRVDDKNPDINNAYLVFLNITEELHTFIKSKINNDNLGVYAKAFTVTKIEYEKLNIEDNKTLDEQLFETQIKYSYLKSQKERIEQLTKENAELRKSISSQN